MRLLLQMTGEELMFTMDVPYNPPQEAPVVLAQAGNTSATVTPDFILHACKETEHRPNDPDSALFALDPAGMLSVYALIVGRRFPVEDIKVTMLSNATHGKVTDVVDNLGRSWYRYDPTPGYLGNDRATFMAGYGGKRYKIIVDIKVLFGIDENSPVCPDATLIKVRKPATGSSDSGPDRVQ